MQIGMRLHRVAPPRPSSPSFERIIPTTVSPNQGMARLLFYVPKDWRERRESGKDRFPVVVVFHGGGFTLGAATDDTRWATTVVKRINAIVVAVDSRLAPEHSFPTAVEDGVDSVLYIARHADELHIDTNKIAISGFSSGGNMAFTVPLRLLKEVDPAYERTWEETPHAVKADTSAEGTTVIKSLQNLKIAAIIAFYPSTGYTVSRVQRRETSAKKDKELSNVFTELFDESYLAPPGIDLSSPYWSPAVAPRHMLKQLPNEIVMYTCGWDMLRAEGERLKGRLEGMGKNVTYRCIPHVPHGFDKAPNPFGIGRVKKNYKAVCSELQRNFEGYMNFWKLSSKPLFFT